MKRKLLLIFCLFNVVNTFSQWQKANGPYGGIVQCIAKSDSYIVAGCYWNESGIFISENNGGTWEKVINTDKPSYQSPDFFTNKIVQGSAPDVFYVASDGEGVYKLFYNNNEWELQNIGFREQQKYISSIVYLQGNIFASIYGEGIYKTSNEGQGWQEVNNGLQNTEIMDLEVTNDSIFACTSEGLYISKNMGNDWSLFNTTLKGKPVMSIYINEKYICIGVGRVGADRESTYVLSKEGDIITSPSDIIVNPFYTPIALVDGKLYGGHTTEGLHYSELPVINWQKATPDLDGQWPKYITKCDDGLLVGVNGFGIYKSINGGSTWQESSVGMYAYKFLSIQTMGEYIFAATDINGVFRSTDNGQNWERINNGSYVTDLLISDSILYLANGSVLISKDKGDNWEQTGAWGEKLAANDKIVYSVSPYTGIYESADSGKTWQQSNFLDADKLIRDIDVQDSIILIGTHYGGPYFSVDSGKTWTQIETSSSETYASNVLIQGSSFFVTSSNIYKSDDFGQSWQIKNNGLCCIPVELMLNDTILFGTFPTTGVYSLDKGENWEILDDLPGLSAISSNDEYFFAGTYDGFYFHPLSSLFVVSSITERFKENNFSLFNYPNPFKDNTTIEYELLDPEKQVTFSVHDLTGKIVYISSQENLSTGKHKFIFDASRLNAGTYIYKIRTNNNAISMKMIKH